MPRRKKLTTSETCPYCKEQLNVWDWYGHVMKLCMNWRCPRYRQPAFQRRYQEVRNG